MTLQEKEKANGEYKGRAMKVNRREGEGRAVSRGKNREKEDTENGSTEREGGMYVEMGWETIETERKAS